LLLLSRTKQNVARRSYAGETVCTANVGREKEGIGREKKQNAGKTLGLLPGLTHGLLPVICWHSLAGVECAPLCDSLKWLCLERKDM
jgi:hypothetical protein